MRERHWPRGFGRKAGQDDKSGGVALARPRGRAHRDAAWWGHQVGPAANIGLVLNLANPSLFAVGGPPGWLAVVSIAVLVPGVAIWGWSAILIVTNVPRGRLITSGPFAWVKHPLYTAVALLVLPWAGLLLNSWLGIALGLILYLGSRIFSPAEEAELARTFGDQWRAYDGTVRLRRL